MKTLINWVFCAAFFAAFSTSRGQEVSESLLERHVHAYFQELYSQNLKAVYVSCHPIGSRVGTPDAVTVNEVRITQWKNGTPSENGSDVVQFTVDYTILWKSVLHPLGGGYTKARSTYNVAEDEIIPEGNLILGTNAKRLKAGQVVGLLKLGHIAKLALLFIH